MSTTYFVFAYRLMSAIHNDISSFFAGKGKGLLNFDNYHSIFLEYSAGFGVGGWTMYILLILLVFGLAGSAVAFFVFTLRRFVLRAIPKKAGVIQAEEEIESLKMALFKSEKQKDILLDGNKRNTFSGTALASPQSRFPRLEQLDILYSDQKPREVAECVELHSLAQGFRNYAASKLHLFYSEEIVRQFLSSLASSRLLVLEGISGTGKTSLPYAFGEYVGAHTNICSVQSSWHEKSDFIGYYNDFTAKFTETEALISMYRALYEPTPSIIVLDEMNIARVEYYFAEILSLLENPSSEDKEIQLVAQPLEDDPKHLRNGKLKLADGLFFVGTINNDDSTFALADKVYDRAMTVSLQERGVPFECEETESAPLAVAALNAAFAKAVEDHPIPQKIEESLQNLVEFLYEEYGISIGNRLQRQWSSYLPCYVACGGEMDEAVDSFLVNKLPRKLAISIGRGNGRSFQPLLDFLTDAFGQDVLPMTSHKIRSMEAR